MGHRVAFGPFSLREDLHLHSTFSDGKGRPEEVHARALELGLDRIGFADHVRRDTDWIPEYRKAIGRLASASSIEVVCGVEAKILDESGSLDLPPDALGCDVVLVADHRLPFEDRCLVPGEARRLWRSGKVSPGRLIEGLLAATCESLRLDRPTIVAHLFSILPKIGLREEDVEARWIVELGRKARAAGAAVEISERWRCPGRRTVGLLAECGVTMVASTDSHDLASIGRYDYVASVGSTLPPSGPRAGRAAFSGTGSGPGR